MLIGKGVDWATDAGLAAQYNADFSAFGPFPLTAGAGDLCYLAELAPGAYTVQITAASAGNAMTEMYFLP